MSSLFNVIGRLEFRSSARIFVSRGRDRHSVRCAMTFSYITFKCLNDVHSVRAVLSGYTIQAKIKRRRMETKIDISSHTFGDITLNGPLSLVILVTLSSGKNQ